MFPSQPGFKRATRFAVSSLGAALIASSAAAAQVASFSATLGFIETIAGPQGSCDAIGSVTGVGLEPQLGVVRLTSQDCINVIGFDTATGVPIYRFAGDGLSFTLANGQMLFGRYEGTFTPQADGTYRIAGQFTVTGGTGRYSKATGGGTLSGVEDISTVPAKGVVQLTGTISR
jgi:hypothetical protein